MGKDWRLKQQVELAYRQRGKRRPSNEEEDARLRREWKPDGWDRTKRTVSDRDKR